MNFEKKFLFFKINFADQNEITIKSLNSKQNLFLYVLKII